MFENSKSISCAVIAGLGVAVAGLLLVPQLAFAASNGVTADEVVTALAGDGLPVDLGEDLLGDPEIESSIGDTKFAVLFWDCLGDVCGSIQFTAGYLTDGDISHEIMNEWNADNLYGQAYLDEELDPIIDMAVPANGGITASNLRHAIQRWRDVVADFEDHIGWNTTTNQTAAVASAPVTIDVCNESGDGVSLAFATAAGGKNDAGETLFRSEGWINLEDGDCTDLWESPFENRYYYIYAEADDGEYSGDYFFCTLEDAFEIVDTQCSAEYERDGFLQIDMETGNRYANGYTVTLDP